MDTQEPQLDLFGQPVQEAAPELEGEPPSCSKCGCLGHTPELCDWRPKRPAWLPIAYDWRPPSRRYGRWGAMGPDGIYRDCNSLEKAFRPKEGKQ